MPTVQQKRLLYSGNSTLKQIELLIKRNFIGAYWWQGEDATLSSWVDRLQGVTLASGGSGGGIGTLNGRVCPVFNTSNYYISATGVAVSQPYTIIAVHKCIDENAQHTIYDSNGGSNRNLLAHINALFSRLQAPTPLDFNPMGTSAIVSRAILNGSNSRIYLNNFLWSFGDAGTNSAGPGFVIGSRTTANYGHFYGTIASVVLLPAISDITEQISILFQKYYSI